MNLMMTDAQRNMMLTWGTTVGRIFLGLIFFIGGVGMLMNGAPVGAIASKGIPLASLVAWVVVAIKVLGGAGLILGYRVGLSAAALFVFVLLTIVFFHNVFSDPTQQTAALKNLAIMGGLLYVMAYGAGEGWKIGK
jgi:putative oxidoreductase